MERARLKISSAQPHETGDVLTLVEELLTELGEEGEEFACINKTRLWSALQREQGRANHRRSSHVGNDDRFLALLARDRDGALLGVLTLSTAFALYAGGEYGIIEEMYVRPSHRGQGVGTRLLERALAIARERGWFRLEVTGPAAAGKAASENAPGPAAADADRAIRFYERLGFEHAGPKLRLLMESPAPTPESSVENCSSPFGCGE